MYWVLLFWQLAKSYFIEKKAYMNASTVYFSILITSVIPFDRILTMQENDIYLYFKRSFICMYVYWRVLSSGICHVVCWKTSRALLATRFTLVSCLTYSFTIKMEMNMFLWNNSWLSTNYMALFPEDMILHNHHCENLKSYKFYILQKFMGKGEDYFSQELQQSDKLGFCY
jgi:hypothetical protein